MADRASCRGGARNSVHACSLVVPPPSFLDGYFSVQILSIAAGANVISASYGSYNMVGRATCPPPAGADNALQIVDSGTTLLILPEAVYTALLNTLSVMGLPRFADVRAACHRRGLGFRPSALTRAHTHASTAHNGHRH
jgi:hypothetical protein